ncbi:MAG: RNA polymerase sigma-70 factor (ECF subfamily) [Gammaproteobacteria bacterium]|jgi:RNA polymerase sigma-70 factor (ECF subfamily)
MLAQIPRLRRYAYSLTGDTNRGDDLVQECLERAWSRRRLYDPARPIRPWLFTIMHNLHVNQIRRNATEPMIVSSDEHLTMQARAATEPGAIDIRDLQRALDLLAPLHREVLVLVGLEQLSYRETAQTLGVPVGTVMSRLSRAREQLREHLQGNTTVPNRSAK